MLLWLAICCAGAVEFPSDRRAGDILLDIGSMAAKPHLGHGWSLAERARGRDYRWIRSREAEVMFSLAAPAAVRMWIEAVPAYVAYTRQSVAVFVNGRFVATWVCQDDIHFAAYAVDLPEGVLRAGVNRLILRMGYRTRAGSDPRDLSLCVDRILLRPMPRPPR